MWANTLNSWKGIAPSGEGFHTVRNPTYACLKSHSLYDKNTWFWHNAGLNLESILSCVQFECIYFSYTKHRIRTTYCFLDSQTVCALKYMVVFSVAQRIISQVNIEISLPRHGCFCSHHRGKGGSWIRCKNYCTNRFLTGGYSLCSCTISCSQTGFFSLQELPNQ